jgi:uncharacterized protein YbbC (DUF1343 family)
VLGAPWIKGKDLAAYLNARNIAGIRFVPTTFTPTASNFAHQECYGVNLIVTNREVLDAPELGVELASALLKLFDYKFDLIHMNGLLVSKAVYTALQVGRDPRRIADDWRGGIDQFMLTRAKYLMY